MARKKPKYEASLGPSKSINLQLNDILMELDKEIKNLKKANAKGLVHAAYHIRRETESVYPATPVDLGNLRASWFTVSSYGGIEPDPLGLSGTFKNRIGKKMQFKASELKAQHKAIVGAAQAEARSKRGEPLVIFGYTANYALYVHEGIGFEFTERTPPAGYQWLQRAMERNKKEIVKIVEHFSQIP